MVALAQEHKVIRGRRLRLDTTVGEANIHYPIDSGLLGDGVRVLTRLMKKVTAIAGQAGSRLRDRSRSVQRRLIEIGRASRSKGPEAGERVQTAYGKLLAVTGRVVGQAKKFSAEIEQGVKRAAGVVRQAMLETLQAKLDTMRDRIQQVIRQTKARAFGGNTHVEGKLISLFEPDAEIIRKGKAGKPNEFGKMVKIQEAENQIIIAYQVYDRRPNDRDLLIPAGGNSSTTPATPTRTGGGRCRLLLRTGRNQSPGNGGETRLSPQPFQQKRRAAATSKATLVPQGTAVENRL